MLQRIYRSLPDFKGKRRLAKLLFPGTVKNSRDLYVKGRYDIRYKLPNLIENVAFDIFVFGAYEEEYIRFLVDSLPRHGVMLDLGANIGAICIPVAVLRPDVTIIAVEASTKVFEYLQANVQQNGCNNIKLQKFALSSADNEQVAFYSPDEKFGKGSMSAVYTDKAEYATTITVDTIIEKYGIEKVDIIKIDVEGYEGTVFKGGRKLLSRPDAPVVLFEFAGWAENAAKNTHAGDSQKILLQYGYKLYDLTNPRKPLFLPQPLSDGTFMLMADKKQ